MNYKWENCIPNCLWVLLKVAFMHLLNRRKYQGVSKQMRTELKFSILQCFITTSLLELARDKKTVVFTGKTKNTLWPVLLQFSFSLQSLNYRFLLKKYDGKARVFDLLCCEEKILTKTLPPFVWVKAIKKIKSKLLDYNVTIKMNKVIYRLFCKNTYCIQGSYVHSLASTKLFLLCQPWWHFLAVL